MERLEKIISSVDAFFEKNPDASFDDLENFLIKNFDKESIEEYFQLLGETMVSLEKKLKDPVVKMMDNDIEVKIIKNPDEDLLKKLDVEKWPIWTKEVSKFDWYYDDSEVCYILEGKVKVHTENGEYIIEKGDLVRFKKGLSCTWDVLEDIKKHYNFGINI